MTLREWPARPPEPKVAGSSPADRHLLVEGKEDALLVPSLDWPRPPPTASVIPAPPNSHKAGRPIASRNNGAGRTFTAADQNHDRDENRRGGNGTWPHRCRAEGHAVLLQFVAEFGQNVVRIVVSHWRNSFATF